ncbi:hypothetical protein C7E17_26590, partial [Stenotrophomonas maltophilia]
MDCGSRQALPGAGLQVSVRTASFAAARTFGSIRSTSAICVRMDCGSRQALPGAGLQVSVRTASFAAARTFGSI